MLFLTEEHHFANDAELLEQIMELDGNLNYCEYWHRIILIERCSVSADIDGVGEGGHGPPAPPSPALVPEMPSPRPSPPPAPRSPAAPSRSGSPVIRRRAWRRKTFTWESRRERRERGER
jgi:hypothetical protein